MPADPFPDFKITSQEEISRAFKNRNIDSFKKAAEFIRKLPYKRNLDKTNLLTVFSDGFGVCSTKHALLKQLAKEHNVQDMMLVVGIYRMGGDNTPRLRNTLQEKGLNYIPEAHCYLKYDNVILDVTSSGSSENDFVNDLLIEDTIQPDQIGSYKVDLHKKFLKKWLDENPEITYSLEELWEIRESCIGKLSV